MSIRIRTRALAAILAVTTGALVLIAAPAQAEPQKDAGGVCWLDTSAGVTQCFDDEAAFQDAVADSGHYLVEEDSALAGRPPAGALALYVIARFYENAGYGGGTAVATHASSTICSTSSVSANLTSFNDRTSSYHSYYGCTTKIFEHNGGGGASFGYAVDAASVGALNDLASSYTVT